MCGVIRKGTTVKNEILSFKEFTKFISLHIRNRLLCCGKLSAAQGD
jgi:hypothetical protein